MGATDLNFKGVCRQSQPEIFRPLAQYRQAVYGLLLVLVMAFLPFGVYDTIAMKLHNRRLARAGMLKPKAGS